MHVVIKSIPHGEQVYPTVGDYRTDEHGVDHIRVSAAPDWRFEVLIAVHELVEWMLCRHRGIKDADIDAFDIQYEKERDEGKHSPEDEPGFDPRAPYRDEHSFATAIEMALARELLVDWKAYEAWVAAQ